MNRLSPLRYLYLVPVTLLGLYGVLMVYGAISSYVRERQALLRRIRSLVADNTYLADQYHMALWEIELTKDLR